MALATQCPHCKTIFRVAQDQLKLRGGIVRCGACHEIFDGSASLVDMAAATAAPADAPAAPRAVVEAPASPTPTEASPVTDEEVPVYALDLGAALGPLGILPKPEAEEHEAAAPVADSGEVAHAGEAHEEVQHDESAHAQALARSDELEERVDATPADEMVMADEAVQAEEPAHPGEPEQTGEHGHDDARVQASEPLEVNDATPPADALPDAVDTGEAPAFTSSADADAHTAVPDDSVEPALQHADEELVATVPREEHDLDFGSASTASAAHSGFDHAPLPQRESADAANFAPPPPQPKSARARQQARRSKLTPTKIDAPKLRVPEIDEPEFVKRGRQREQSGKRRVILMTAGSIVLLLVLAVQAAIIFRNELVARMPAMRPALTSMCAMLHCRVELPARIDNLTIETGELQTLGPDTYVLATLLHNQGGATQAWPAIELALTDATDKPLVRRVFTPAEYLPKGAAAGFAAHGEQAVKLYFQLDQLKPSGYHIAVFYP